MAKGKLRGEQIKDESIESVDIASGSIKAGELNEEAISGQTLITAVDATDDRLLVWDNDDSALKQVAPKKLFEESDIQLSIGTSTAADTTLNVFAETSGDYATLITNNENNTGHGLKVLVRGSGAATKAFEVYKNNGDLALTINGTGKVGINKATPQQQLTVDGDIGVGTQLVHVGDPDTYISFTEDDINIQAGGVDFIKITESTQDKIVFNDGGADVDFTVESPGESKALYLNAGNEVFHINHGQSSLRTKIHNTNDEVLTVTDAGAVFNDDGHADIDFRVESDTNTHMVFVDAGGSEVGIGFSSPNSTFHVSGSQAGNYTDVSTSGAGALTFGASHFIVNYTGDGDAVFTLPNVSGITGRQYHILHNCQGTTDVLTVTGSGGQFLGAHLEGPQNSINLSNNTPQSISIVSTGDNWFILHDGRPQE